MRPSYFFLVTALIKGSCAQTSHVATISGKLLIDWDVELAFGVVDPVSLDCTSLASITDAASDWAKKAMCSRRRSIL